MGTILTEAHGVKLSATRVRALKAPGRYSDGDGLHLFISKRGGKSWVQRKTVDGRRRDIGLGGYPSVSLAQARKRAADNREAIANGRDPVADKHKAAVPTFSEAAYAVHEVNKPRWRNGSHTSAWIQTLERHAFPKIGRRRIDSHIWQRRVECANAHMVDSSRDRASCASEDANDIQVVYGE